MPVRLGSRSTEDPPEPRIEIIPLIDIMFFLLAAFMLVSLSMVKLKQVPVDLPTATPATEVKAEDPVSLTIDSSGIAYLDAQPVGDAELALRLAERKNQRSDTRVTISADQNTRHGDVMRVLELTRSAGIDRVAFAVRPPVSPAKP
jgi:biopolymer transport protein ExbD